MSRNRSKSAFFEGRWVTLSADFRGKGASPTNQCWCRKTRVIAVSCGIKISAVQSFSFLTIHTSGRQTDGRKDGQKCDSNTVRCITCSRTVKTRINGLPVSENNIILHSFVLTQLCVTDRRTNRPTDMLQLRQRSQIAVIDIIIMEHHNVYARLQHAVQRKALCRNTVLGSSCHFYCSEVDHRSDIDEIIISIVRSDLKYKTRYTTCSGCEEQCTPDTQWNYDM